MELQYLKNVVSLYLNPKLCNGCKICLDVCPHAVFIVENHKAQIIDRDSCMECGACVQNCEPKAIMVNTGVGCAAAVISGALTGKEPSCDGSTSCC